MIQPADAHKMIGKFVCKISGKPFKSTFKYAKVKDVVKHPYREGELAFTFEEDDSVVGINVCRENVIRRIEE